MLNNSIILTPEKVKEIEYLGCYMWLYLHINDTIQDYKKQNITDEEMEKQIESILEYIYNFVLPKNIVAELKNNTDVMSFIAPKVLKLDSMLLIPEIKKQVQLIARKKIAELFIKNAFNQKDSKSYQ